ncbi:YcaO-like family protein [Serratia fonticola]|uniref:YcaO-like family protein n=1 Tax=Serratia fonticola TaxID=47917 RepID=UPI003AAB28AF
MSYWIFDSYQFRRHCSFAKIIDPLGGIVGRFSQIETRELGVPSYYGMFANLGDLSLSYPWIRRNDGSNIGTDVVGGAGSGSDPYTGCVRAVAEAAERYATSVFVPDEVCIATAQELGNEAIDYRRFPKCSAQEYANPHALLRPFDPNKPIRWIRGYSAIAKRPLWVPLVMSHIIYDQAIDEMFWLPITTGVAAHTDPYQAAVNAICELIERDAIALTWLAKLPLSRIEFDTVPPASTAAEFRMLQRMPLQQYFFDATTDFGIPIVYSLQIMEGHPKASNFVACSVEFNPWDACNKVIREAINGRTSLEFERKVPEHPDQFYSLEDGAHYMGQASQHEAFNFLLSSGNSIPISLMKAPPINSPQERLLWLVERFRALNFELVLVELTTDDLKDAGLTVFRAICSDLMPLDFTPATRFKGHNRLYDYPEKAGFGRPKVTDLNPYPQPFA